MGGFFDYPGTAHDATAGPARSVPVLAGCTDREWAVVQSHCTREVIRRGQTLIRQGVIDRSLYVILSGAFAAVLPDGSPTPPMRAGEVFGELAFFDGTPRSASVVAVADAEVLHLSFTAFESLAAAEPALAQRLLMDLGRVLAGRLRAAEARER